MVESRPGASWITVGWHPAGWCDAALFGDTLVVRVNQADVWRETVGPLRFPSIAAKRNGQIKVAGALQGADGIDRVTVVANGVVLNTNEHAYGLRPVRLVVEDDHFVVYAMDAPRTWIRLTLDPWTVTRHANPFAYGSSAGLLDVVSGMPIFAESILGGLVERDGLRFPQTRNGLTAGQLAGPDAIAVLEAGQTTPTVVLRGPCYESDLARAEDGTFIVAARTPSGASIVSGPPWPVLPDIQPDIPTFQKTYQPIGIGLFFDDPSEPSCHQGDHKVAQFYTLDRDDYALAQAEADRLNVPLLAYKDDHGLQPSDIPFGARAAVFCYPSPSRTVASTLDLIRLDCTRLRDAGIEIDLVVALYRQWAPGDRYSWSEQQALDVLAGAWELAREFNVGALWGFARRRIYNGTVVDGVDRWPAFQEALRRLRAASGDPQAFPRRAAPTPPPVPPPTPPPAPEPVPMPDPPAPVPDLPTIHSGPWTESYRREVMEKHGIDPGPSYGTGLTPLEPLVWRTTRDEVRAINGDFAWTAITGENSDWQSYMYCSWPTEKRAEFRAKMRALGATHAWIAPVMAYDVGPVRVADVDCRQKPKFFLWCLDELMDDMLIPIVQIGEGHYYGVKDDAGIDRLIADLDRWHEWGWAQACDGLAVNLWPESNGETYPWQIIRLARKVRQVLPNSYIGVHVGPDGDSLYQGHGDDPSRPDYYDRTRFWNEIGPVVDALFWQAKADIFHAPHPDKQLVVEVLGAIARVMKPLSPSEARERAARAGVVLDSDDIVNITRNGGLITPKSVDVVFYEAAQYEFKQSSTEKSRISKLARAVGATGSLVGVV